jgi:hypothetical protein
MNVERNPENGKFRRLTMSEAEYMQLQEDHGICLGCDNTQSPVEPDARRVTCDSCEKPFVYGLAQLLLMGRIEFTAVATEEETHIG